LFSKALPVTEKHTSLVRLGMLPGNDPYCNPSHIADGSGWEMPFIHGLRAEQELVEMMTEGLIDPPESANESDLF